MNSSSAHCIVYIILHVVWLTLITKQLTKQVPVILTLNIYQSTGYELCCEMVLKSNAMIIPLTVSKKKGSVRRTNINTML